MTERALPAGRGRRRGGGRWCSGGLPIRR